MSIAATIAAAKRELAVLKTATCEIRTAATQWAANPSARCKCHYAATPPKTGGELDYEAGNGYGYTVEFVDRAVAIVAKDVIVIVASPIAADVGMELQVQRIPERSNVGLSDRVEAVKR